MYSKTTDNIIKFFIETIGNGITPRPWVIANKNAKRLDDFSPEEIELAGFELTGWKKGQLRQINADSREDKITVIIDGNYDVNPHFHQKLAVTVYFDDIIGSITRINAHVVSYTFEDLIQQDKISTEVSTFLINAFSSNLNILITGLASTGKTTLLNALLKKVAVEGQHRVILFEDFNRSEFNIFHEDKNSERYTTDNGVVCFLSNTPGEVFKYEYIDHALRMRPDTIVFGDIKLAKNEEIFVNQKKAIDMITNFGLSFASTALHQDALTNNFEKDEAVDQDYNFDIVVEMEKTIHGGRVANVHQIVSGKNHYLWETDASGDLVKVGDLTRKLRRKLSENSRYLNPNMINLKDMLKMDPTQIAMGEVRDNEAQNPVIISMTKKEAQDIIDGLDKMKALLQRFTD